MRVVSLEYPDYSIRNYDRTDNLDPIMNPHLLSSIANQHVAQTSMPLQTDQPSIVWPTDPSPLVEVR